MFPIRFALALFLAIFGSGLAYGGGTNNLTALTNLVTCPGENATFSTVASGPLPYKFQWKKDGTTLAGRTNSSLTITNVSAANTGTYSVVLTGGHDTVTKSATLSLKTPVSATPLTNLVRSIGANAVFSTVASGTGPFAYLWKKNGAVIPGQTTASLTLTNLTSGSSGTYAVIVSGACGSSVTNSATLMVDTCFPAVDIMLIIDRSKSMLGKPYDDARQACSNFVHNLYLTPNADQAGLASYNSSATLDQKLTNSSQVLDQAIKAIPAASGFTSISLGLQTGQGELVSSRHHSQALPVIVLLSDGLPTGSDSKSNALFNATQAKNAGTRIFTVGFGAVDPVLLAGIASATNDYFYGTNSSQLTALFDAISTIICRPPTNIVVAGPTNQTLCPGLTASFAVTATGCDPFSYQWRKDGIKLNGQTNSSLVVPNVSATNAGLYAVEVTGACRSVTNSATLTVNAPVLVTSPLASQTNCPGGTAVFSVGATGTSLTYQWYKGATSLNGKTTNSLTLTNVSAADAGTYSVVINGACGSSVTNSTSLILNVPIIVNSPPTNQVNCPGTTAAFSIGATGTGLSYQWLKGTNVLPGRTGPSLILNNVSGADQGVYNVIVSGTCGSVTNTAALTVNTAVSATPLVNQSGCPAGTVTYFTIVSGTGPFSFSWRKNGNPLGQTGPSLTLNNLSTNDAGTYSVIVIGACGSVTNSATLTVNPTVQIVTPPANQTTVAGSNAVFNVVATGTGLSYQWLFNGQVVGTESSLTLNNVSTNQAGNYCLFVSGDCGTAASCATLAVNVPVAVVTPPANQTNCPGSTAVFSVNATGSALSYQWSHDTNLLASQIGSTLILTSVSATDAGIYSVVVSGAVGGPITNSATLTVNADVVMVTPPVSQTNCPGSTAMFSANATGTGLSYQWYFGASALNGETNNNLTLADVSAADAGTYRIVIAGECASITNSVTLTVNTVVSVSPLANQTLCPGGTATFNATASGTGPFNYIWRQNGNAIDGQTANVLLLTNVSANAAGTYSVIVSGACGSVTNSAALVVNQNTTASPLSNQAPNPGETAVFATVASGTGPFTYVWKKSGIVIPQQNGSSLTLSNVTVADEATYTVEVTGTCNTAIQNATLHINLPPTVNIFSPTNGTTFLAPANFTLAANAVDLDGVVTNVVFFEGTNKLGDTAIGNPFVTMLTNVSAGSHTFTARATDNSGASGTSAPVSITVMMRPPTSIISAVHFNPQTGLYEQTVRVTNPTYTMFDAVRIYVSGLSNTVRVYNPSGTTNGLAYVQSNAAIPPGAYVDFVIEYYVPIAGLVPNPTLLTELVSPGGGNTTVVGAGSPINRAFVRPDKNFLVEFATLTNRLYYIQYSTDLKNWKTAQPAVAGSGTWIQWIDNGQPKTDSAPALTPMRFYRVILLP